jgi:hypothetical protein
MFMPVRTAAGGTPNALPTIMTVRITSSPLETGTLVRIDGELAMTEVSEVDAVCRSVAGPIVLVLAELRALDAAGEACLRSLIAGGATVDAATPYIRMRLGLEGA